MYDIHCHITFDVDDGSQTLDESVRMAEIAYASGVKGIVSTPHTNVPGSHKNYWSNELLEKVKLIRDELKKEQVPIKIFCGQEIFCTRETVKMLEDGKLITLNNTKFPLVEFGFYEKSQAVFSMLKDITRAGYVPIIAHPERYLFIQEHFENIEKLRRSGCLIQVNKGSLLGNFGDSAMDSANRILETRQADVVSSDAHSPYVRNTGMLEIHEYICENFSYDYANYVLDYSPGLILRNSEIFRY